MGNYFHIPENSGNNITHQFSELGITTFDQDSTLFLRFTEASGQGLGIATLNGNIHYMNPTLCKMVGEKYLEDAIGKSFRHYYPEEMQRRLENEIIPQVMQSGQWKGELAIISRDGSYYSTLENFFLIKDDNNLPLYLADVITDITEQKKIERELIESGTKFRQFVEGTDDLVLQVDASARIKYVNKQSHKFFGLSPKECFGLTIFSFVHPDDLELTQNSFSQWIDNHISSISFENRIFSHTGDVYYMLWTINPRFDEDGNVLAIDSIARDITDRKKAEDELKQHRENLEQLVAQRTNELQQLNKNLEQEIRERKQFEIALEKSEKRFRAIFEGIRDAIFIAHPETRQLLDCNEQALILSEYSRKELLSLKAHDLHPEDILEITLQDFQKHADGKILVIETELLTRNKQRIPVSINTSLVNINDEKLLVSVFRDISEQKQALFALKESEERFRTLFTELNDGFFIMDEKGTYLFVNQALAQIYGFKNAESLIDKNFFDFIVSENQERIQKQYRKIIEDRESIEAIDVSINKVDGSQAFLSVRLSPIIHDEKAYGTRGVIRDITERIIVEKNIKALSERSEAILASVPDIIMQVDKNKVYCWSNKSGYAFFGDDVIGKEAAYYFEGDQVTYTTVDPIFKGDENVIYVESWQRRKDGEKRLLAWWCRVLKDSMGNPIGAISTARDITDNNMAELERKNTLRKLERSNKALEQFAYIASHDIQEPLRKIQAFGDQLSLKYKDHIDEKGKDYLQRIQDASQRMQNLINDLLHFSKLSQETKPFVKVDLKAVVDQIIDDYEIQLQQKNGSVRIGDLPIILAEPTRIRQLMQNLISNGLKFCKQDVAPVIKISCQQQEQNFEITFEDNGIGFDEKHSDRIFTIFQRLHKRDEYEGTGIGLAVCRKIVEMHNGSITATSKPGVGSRFIVTLPILQTG